MIKRIVRMEFLPEHIDRFAQLFEAKKATIRGFEGCSFLELWQDAHEPGVFFTHSNWDSEAHLNAYRDSAFFAETWRETKSMFAQKASAWTVLVRG